MRSRLRMEIKPERPYMVTGLPGAAGVAKLSADYLVKQLKGELLEELYSDAFPPHVLIKKDGTVELLRNELYYCKDSKSKNGLIVFTGNTQAVSPEGQYDVANETIARARRLGVVRLFATAAFVVEEPPEKPRVHGAASDPSLIEELKEYGVVPMEAGSITGTNGLLFGLATLQGIPSVCLLSETPAYTTPTGRFVVDAKAAQALLEVLTKMLHIEIDMKPLEEEAKLSEEFMQRMQEIEQRTIEEVRRAAAPRPPKEQMYV
ncbi:proteasome assembly chaperone family protein [[Eubacterium] cellulosolvens]